MPSKHNTPRRPDHQTIRAGNRVFISAEQKEEEEALPEPRAMRRRMRRRRDNSLWDCRSSTRIAPAAIRSASGAPAAGQWLAEYRSERDRSVLDRNTRSRRQPTTKHNVRRANHVPSVRQPIKTVQLARNGRNRGRENHGPAHVAQHAQRL